MPEQKNLSIIGIDEKRPPRVRKEHYIDIFYRLSQKASGEWCDIFNTLSKQLVPPAKINKSEGIYIEAYVRDMNLLQDHLDKIKKNITESNERLATAVRKRNEAITKENAGESDDGDEQRRLNAIVASLHFS